jgi:hypothetical protein
MHAIEIRPRFTLVSSLDVDQILKDLEEQTASDSKVFCKILDNHAYIKIVQKDHHFWSPELHLTVEETNDGSLVKGVVGPAPTVWTMFMFLYFATIIGVLFASIYCYTDWTINKVRENLWPLPVSILALIGVFVASKSGERIARRQTETLKLPLRKVLAKGNLHEVVD